MTQNPLPGLTWLDQHCNATLLIFHARKLGDLLCTVPALRALRTALPHVRIVLVGLPWAHHFAARFPRYIDEFIAFPVHDAFPRRLVNYRQLASFFAAMRTRRFDAALQMHGPSEQNNNIARAFGARALAGFGFGFGDGDGDGDGARFPYERFHPGSKAGPEPLRQLDLVSLLGAPAAGVDLEFPVTQADECELSASGLAADLTPGEYVCIHPGAGKGDTCWDPARFAQVADQIAMDFDVQIVLTGSAGEAPLTAAVASRMHFKAIDAACPMSTGALAALMSRARLLVTNNSCVSQIAAGLKLNSVVIFASADMRRWAPLDARRHRCLCDPDGDRVPEVLGHVWTFMSEQNRN